MDSVRRSRLHDGALVSVRPIAPGDARALGEAFQRLTPETRLNRFHGHFNELTPAMLHYLTVVDGVDHVAFVALSEDDELVGVGRWVRDRVEPEAAEVALTIADGWQRRGLGRLLLDELVDAAGARSVSRFVAHTLRNNAGIRRLLHAYGDVRARPSEHEETLELVLPHRRAVLA